MYVCMYISISGAYNVVYKKNYNVNERIKEN